MADAAGQVNGHQQHETGWQGESEEDGNDEESRRSANGQVMPQYEQNNQTDSEKGED